MSRTIVALPGLSERLAAKAGTEQAVAEAFIIAYFDFITRGLTVSESVTVKGLGTFSRTADADNPVAFKPAAEFESEVNRPFAIFQPVVIDASLDADDVIAEAIPAAEEPSAEEPEHSAPAAQEPEQIEEPELPQSESAPSDSSAPSNPSDRTEPDEEPSASAGTKPATETAEESDQSVSPEPSEEPETSDELDDEPSPEPKYDEIDYEPTPSGVSQRRHMAVSMLMLTIGIIVGAVFGFFLNDYLKALQIKAEQSSVEAELLAADSLELAEDTIAIAPAAIAKDTVKTASIEEPVAKPAERPEPVVTDTVTSQRFLTSMARKYYGHMEYWAFIYEANADRLGHPNRIKPGTVVVIPSLKSITANDKDEAQTRERARRTGAAIYARYE